MLPIQINLVINLMMFLLILYMQIESSNNSKDEAFAQSLKIEKENIICKDGFCTLPNQKQNQNQNQNIIKNNVNLFDPI